MTAFLDAEYAPSVIEQSLTESHVSWFVAETDRPVGFMKVTWDAMLPETDKRGVLLNKLYLDPAETGKHYGQDMFNKIIDMARSRGKDSLSGWKCLSRTQERTGSTRSRACSALRTSFLKQPHSRAYSKLWGCLFRARALVPLCQRQRAGAGRIEQRDALNLIE
ncbi:TPA: N-acetyltransferase family protein [Enterobacter roggenkampii]